MKRMKRSTRKVPKKKGSTHKSHKNLKKHIYKFRSFSEAEVKIAIQYLKELATRLRNHKYWGQPVTSTINKLTSNVPGSKEKSVLDIFSANEPKDYTYLDVLNETFRNFYATDLTVERIYNMCPSSPYQCDSERLAQEIDAALELIELSQKS